MRPLVAVRRAASFDPFFIERHALLWPLARAAAALGPLDAFPAVETLARVFEGAPPVRFVAAAPRPRRRRGRPIDGRALYDGRITVDGEVPTRGACWHDLMNALVWGTFPCAKRTLHARQHRLICAGIAPGDRVLPSRRSRELDALALLDEGGLVVLARDAARLRADLRARRGALATHVASGAAWAVVFGHAIYESLVLGVAPAVVATIVLDPDVAAEANADADAAKAKADANTDSDTAAASGADLVHAADRNLARALADETRLRSPTELVRVDLRELAGPERGSSGGRSSHDGGPS